VFFRILLILLCHKMWGGQSCPQPPLRRPAARISEKCSRLRTPSSAMRHYQRRLPHWDSVDQPLFITFRLYGSLPTHRVFPPHSLARSGKAFVAMDRLLDRGASGPLSPPPGTGRDGSSGSTRWRAEIPPLPAPCLRGYAQSRASSRHPSGCGEAVVGAVERVYGVSRQ